jgi:hypothetical protein
MALRISKMSHVQFLAHTATVVSQCTAHAGEWDIDSTRLTEVNKLRSSAQMAYDANTDRATRNHLTTTHKNELFTELKHSLPLFIDYLKGNVSVPDEGLAIMNLRPRIPEKRELLPRLDKLVVITVVVHGHGRMTVYAAQEEHGHPTTVAKPKKYYGFKLRWRFEDETEYRTIVTTWLRYTFHFEQKDEGRRIVFSAAWINPRLEEGPWCADMTEVVE